MILLFVLMVLASYRVTRFIVFDTFPLVLWVRSKLIGADRSKWDGTRLAWFGDLLGCPWCSGAWVSLAVVLVVDHFAVDVSPWWLWWPAVAGASGLIGKYEENI